MKRTLSIITPLLLLPAGAFAHDGGGAHGVVAGLLHPLHGVDHLLVMVAVGLWAASLAGPGGGRALARGAAYGALPFIAAMLAGSALAFTGLALPLVEPMIALSALAVGLLLIRGARLAPANGAAVIALFALFHGFAHGAEAPAAGLAGYLAGMVAMTAALHLGGLLAGRAAAIHRIARLRLGSGALLVGGSLWMLAGV